MAKKTVSEKKIEEKTVEELKKFGFTMAAVFIVIAGLQFYRGRNTAFLIFTALTAAFMLPAIVQPTILRPIEKGWMKFGEVMGNITTPIIVTLTFFIVVTPIGILCRVFGKDMLGLKIDRNCKSYWIPTKPDGPASRPTMPY